MEIAAERRALRGAEIGVSGGRAEDRPRGRKWASWRKGMSVDKACRQKRGREVGEREACRHGDLRKTVSWQKVLLGSVWPSRA